MDALTYRIEQFEGPLDLLLTLVHKNKMNIEDIPISILCDQYLEYIKAAEAMDMELAGEFIVMASELMLIKSRMLLPRATPDEKDPRADLAEALLRFEQAKRAVQKMAPLYQLYSGRMVKDTDEISIDTSYVADQQVTSLCAAVRRIIAANESRPKAEKQVFAPMIAKPIVPVEVKIVGILHHIDKKRNPPMKELLSDATSLPDLIAIFLGILELISLHVFLRIGQYGFYHTRKHTTELSEYSAPVDACFQLLSLHTCKGTVAFFTERNLLTLRCGVLDFLGILLCNGKFLLLEVAVFPQSVTHGCNLRLEHLCLSLSL